MPDHGKASSSWGNSEAGLANPSGKKKDCLGYHDNVGQRGTSGEYVVRRLKRDAPELATALARGDFPSARAAGIAAGFIKPSPPSLQLKDPAPTARCKSALQTVDGKNMAADAHGGEIETGFDAHPKTNLLWQCLYWW